MDRLSQSGRVRVGSLWDGGSVLEAFGLGFGFRGFVWGEFLQTCDWRVEPGGLTMTKGLMKVPAGVP